MHFCSRPIFMKNYTRGFPKSLISNQISKIQYGGFDMAEKIEKTSDFRKSEYTRVFGFAVKNYTRRFSKSLISYPLSNFQNSIWQI